MDLLQKWPLIHGQPMVLFKVKYDYELGPWRLEHEWLKSMRKCVCVCVCLTHSLRRQYLCESCWESDEHHGVRDPSDVLQKHVTVQSPIHPLLCCTHTDAQTHKELHLSIMRQHLVGRVIFRIRTWFLCSSLLPFLTSLLSLIHALFCTQSRSAAASSSLGI